MTLTQAMSGQIDVGWASPPFGLDALDEGKIRLIARGSDAPSTRDQTVRVHIVNASALAQRRAVMERFAAAYRETYEWLYGNPDGVKTYAGYGKVSEKLAIRIRDEFLPKAALQPDRILGVESGHGGRRRLQVPGGAAVEGAARRGHPDSAAEILPLTRKRDRPFRSHRHESPLGALMSAWRFRHRVRTPVTSMLTSSSGVCVVSSMPQLFTHS